MERVSDKELWALIQIAGKHPNYLLTEKFWDTIVSAFTELLERRESAKIAISSNVECPYCKEFHDKKVACMPYCKQRGE